MDDADAAGPGPDTRCALETDGFAVVRGVVPPAFLEAARTVVDQLVERRVDEWCAAGLISRRPVACDLSRRYLEAWTSAGRPDGDGSVDGVVSAPEVEPLLGSRWLHTLACSVLGVQAVSSAERSFVRSRHPGDHRALVPWHQDIQCLRDLVGSDFVTVWLPIDRSPLSTSGLEVADVGIGRRMFACRISELTGYTCMAESDVRELSGARQVRAAPGDLVLLSPWVPHRSMPNQGDRTRWSLDLRMTPAVVSPQTSALG